MRPIFAKSKYIIIILSCILWCQSSFAAAVPNKDINSQNMTFTDVAGEYYHFLALDNTGNVWGWGMNVGNQLGEFAQSYSVTPVQIKGIEDVKLISAGYSHSTAVKEDGTVWKWGQNTDGVLGVHPSTLQFSTQPRQVDGISDVIAISDSGFFTLALRKDGTVWSWGRNSMGQLGNGRISDYESKPVQVQKLTNVTAIYATFGESYALTADGKVWRWGAIPKCSSVCVSESVSTPILFEGLNGVNAISDEIAILQNGTIVKWGINYQGSIGNGSTDYGYFPNPMPVSSLIDIVTVSKTHALTKNGQVWSWGRNDYGQVGDGTNQSRPKPILLNKIDNVMDITSGEEITVALTKDGTLYEWGNNRNGEIANVAADILPPTPVPLTLPKVTYALPIPRDASTWTFLDDKGALIKDNQLYFRVKPFSEGFAAVQRASNNLWTFITDQGKPAFSENFIIVKDFHQGNAAVKIQDGWHFINTKGLFINQDHYQDAGSFSNGLAAVLVNKKWGYIGLNGKMKITPQFAAAQQFENGLAAVQINGKWGFIDSTGKLVIKAIYSAVGPFSKQAAAVKHNGKWGYINKVGAWVIEPQYEEAKIFADTNLAPVKIKGKWGYINLKGKLIIANQYEDASSYQEGLASVKKNGLWAIIQSTGEVSTPFQFVEIQPYRNKMAWVVTKTDKGYIDTNGNWYFKARVK